MEDEDDDLDETAEEEAVFGGDGVRARTSTTFKVNEDSDEDTTEAETAVVVDISTDIAEGADEKEVEEDAVPLLLTRVSFAEGGDGDLDRGTTSTTFKEENKEEESTVEVGVAALDTGGVIDDIE